MLDLAGSGEDQLLRAVVLRHVVEQRLARHGGDDRLGPEDRAAHRLVGIGRFLEQVEDQVVGRVLDLADLLEHDMALLLELVLLDGRMLQDVGDDVGRQRHVRGQHAGIVGGVLARGVGVEGTADLLDLLGDAARRAPARALEGHVLEQVRHPVDLGRLVARADIDPDAEGRGLDVRHGLADDAHPVVQRGQAESGIGHLAGPKLARMWRTMASRSAGSSTMRSGRVMRSRR